MSIFKPTIFVSHSAKGDDRVTLLLDALKSTLCQEGFVPYIDKFRLEAGDEWRKELDSWLFYCHGAILLLSEKALNSSWVLKEATILTARRQLSEMTREGKRIFPILPVVFPEVERSRLDKEPFSPLALNEIQALRGERIEETVEKIRTRIRQLKADLEIVDSPLQGQVRQIAGILSGVKQSLLYDALQKLKSDLPARQFDTDYSIHLARKLVDDGIESLVKVMDLIAPQLDSRSAEIMIEILAPFWVDLSAAARIPVVANRLENQRIFAIDGRREFTAISYIRRACGAFPGWKIVRIPNVSGEDQYGDIVRNIRAIIRRQLRIPEEDTDQDLQEHIEYLVEKNPLFFIISPPRPEKEILEKILASFRGVTFCLLIGDEAALGGSVGLQPPELLQPLLDRVRETNAYNQYRDARSSVAQLPSNDGW